MVVQTDCSLCEPSTTSPSNVANQTIQALARQSMFWHPYYLETSAWLEHIPFAFWLTDILRPRVFVELGTHYGLSYFAFCQAVDKLELDTRCFAIDTWKGDQQAGMYDEQVFVQVQAHNNAQYSAFSRLVRSSFDQALQYFTDGSIDLLHIDGLHTYEAVSHDFNAWLPKLSDRAVVVMHDTNVREREFGVFKIFEELKSSYPAFEFIHGHGLGVLQIGQKQSSLMRQFFSLTGSKLATKEVREAFSRLGRGCTDAFVVKQSPGTTSNPSAPQNNDLTFQHEALLREKEEKIKRLENQNRELIADYERLTNNVNTRFNELAILTQLLEQRDQEIKEKLLEIDRLKESLSWKLTAPLRTLARPFMNSSNPNK